MANLHFYLRGGSVDKPKGYVTQGHDEKVYKVKALYDLKQLIHQGHGHTPESLNVLLSIHCM